MSEFKFNIRERYYWNVKIKFNIVDQSALAFKIKCQSYFSLKKINIFGWKFYCTWKDKNPQPLTYGDRDGDRLVFHFPWPQGKIRNFSQWS